ncbi:beta-propeller fold lactonase family protein [Acholeplasma equirhinis]|uniref:lactonase family protein n=1 Tax=Acholeplasma equirhinis TaxID=555393 RepID=UPI00197AB0E4|nr:beta-propeller fold lactonase family protein [Acholeplasma equirhinis]MBN3490805.1 beta-propeller fold lactonase family protein [Acholeplasma equirhinis]
MKFLVGTYTKNQSEGIYLVEDDKVSLYNRLFNPTYFALGEGHLFTLARGGIEIYQNNMLVYEDHSEAHSPAHIWFEPTLNMIFTANYHVGQMSSYRFDGSNTKKLQTIIYPTGSHAHQVYYSSLLSTLFVVDLGLDTIFTYEIDQNGKLVSKKDLTLHKGVGPRHLVVSDKGFVYCLTEYSHEIYVYNEKLEFVKKFGTIDKQFAGISSAAIRLTHDGRHLYVSNRGYDAITHYLVQPDGLLKQQKIYNTQGKHPRDFNLSLDESHIVVGNMHSNNVSIFSRNTDTGELKFVKHINVPEPSCIVFIP